MQRGGKFGSVTPFFHRGRRLGPGAGWLLQCGLQFPWGRPPWVRTGRHPEDADSPRAFAWNSPLPQVGTKPSLTNPPLAKFSQATYMGTAAQASPPYLSATQLSQGLAWVPSWTPIHQSGLGRHRGGGGEEGVGEEKGRRQRGGHRAQDKMRVSESDRGGQERPCSWPHSPIVAAPNPILPFPCSFGFLCWFFLQRKVVSRECGVRGGGQGGVGPGV